MTPEQKELLQIPKDYGDLPVPLILELLLVIYEFNFRFEPVKAGGSVYLVIGRNDARDTICTLEGSSYLYLLPVDEPKNAVFVNSSFGRFLKCVDAFDHLAKGWDQKTETDKCVADYTKAMSSIDPVCLQNPGSFWNQILEEIRTEIL